MIVAPCAAVGDKQGAADCAKASRLMLLFSRKVQRHRQSAENVVQGHQHHQEEHFLTLPQPHLTPSSDPCSFSLNVDN